MMLEGYIGTGTELQSEIDSMMPGTQIRNMIPTHLNDIVPRELRALKNALSINV